MKLVTLEDDLSGGKSCKKRKIPIHLNVINNITAGNGNGNTWKSSRDNSPDTYSPDVQRNASYYQTSDNSMGIESGGGKPLEKVVREPARRPARKQKPKPPVVPPEPNNTKGYYKSQEPTQEILPEKIDTSDRPPRKEFM